MPLNGDTEGRYPPDAAAAGGAIAYALGAGDDGPPRAGTESPEGAPEVAEVQVTVWRDGEEKVVPLATAALSGLDLDRIVALKMILSHRLAAPDDVSTAVVVRSRVSTASARLRTHDRTMLHGEPSFASTTAMPIHRLA